MASNFHDFMGRIYGLAVIDIVGTVIIVYLLSAYMKWNFITLLIWAFIIGEVVHVIMGIETPITRHFVAYN